MAPKNNEHFATTVRETMSRLGLTQAGVMERGGPSDTTLRKILDNEPGQSRSGTPREVEDRVGHVRLDAAGGRAVPHKRRKRPHSV